MKIKVTLSSVLIIVFGNFAFSQLRVPVFLSGEEGHKSYRIPAIIMLTNGDLLAFAEGRVHGANDFGDIDLVMKRSTDRGKCVDASKR